MINNDFYTAWTAASSLAATMHIFAPNMFGQGLPELDRRRFVAAGALGAGLMLVVGIIRPDLSWIADLMRVYLSEPEWMLRGLIRMWMDSGIKSLVVGHA